MKNQTHTAGPWFVDKSPVDNRIIVQAGTLTVCVVGDEMDTVNADAHLIASAPMLLEALRRAVNHLIMDIGRDGKGEHSTDTPEALEQARAAIAAAQGEKEAA